MLKVANIEVIAKRVASELKPFAAYLDNYDTGRLPADAGSYQIVSQKVKLLLAPHVTNPHVQKFCNESQSLHEIMGNLMVELQPEMAVALECALEEAGVLDHWLQRKRW